MGWQPNIPYLKLVNRGSAKEEQLGTEIRDFDVNEVYNHTEYP